MNGNAARLDVHGFPVVQTETFVSRRYGEDRNEDAPVLAPSAPTSDELVKLGLTQIPSVSAS
jgi:hypothetical protein